MKPEELAEAGFYHDPDDEDADQVSAIETSDTAGALLPMQQNCL